MSALGAIVSAIIIALVAIVVAWILFWWLYRRASKETAFVRTGFGGQKVVVNGGAFVVPVLHEITPVHMNTVRLEVVRSREHALIARDRVRVDVAAEFYVRVGSAPEAIALAARALGGARCGRMRCASSWKAGWSIRSGRSRPSTPSRTSTSIAAISSAG